MAAIWDNGPTDSTQRFVLLALADNASDDGGNAYPSIAELARKCALSERTVIRAIDALIAGGYLIRRRRQSTSNLYQIVTSVLVSAKLSLTNNPESDNLSLSNVTDCHPVNDTVSLSNVTDCHVGGDTVSHDPSYNHQPNRQSNHKHIAPAPVEPDAVEIEHQEKQIAWEATVDLIQYWEQLTKRKRPPDGSDDLREKWIRPFNEVWVACGRNVDAAKAKIQAVRDSILAGGGRIFDPSKLPAHVQALVDAELLPMTARFNGNGHGRPAAPKSVSTPAPGSQPVTW